MDFDRLDTLLHSGNVLELQAFCDSNQLTIKDGKIFPIDIAKVDAQVEYWDKRQLVKKINLNS